MPRFDYDVIVIGGGAGGFVSSKLVAGLGRKVAMIEKRKLGGECTNFGCVPSKALIKAADAAHLAGNLRRYGLEPAANALFTASHVMEHVRSVVRKVSDGHPASAFEKAGITVLFGGPRFLDNHRIELDGKTLSARSFIIATGSSAFIPPIEGLSSVPYLTNENVFDLETLPGSMIILGGGPIGIELAQALGRLGVAVTVVEMLESILVREDRELVLRLAERLRAEGIALLEKTKAVKAARRDGDIILTVEDGTKERREIRAASILVAVGRKANVEGLDLEKAGVTYSAKGIVTDRALRTAAPNIYACGDVVGPYQFSHMAEYQAVIAGRNAVLPFKARVNYESAAWCTFTDPELAHAGLTEEEAMSAHGDGVRVYRYEYKNTDRARTDVAEFGMAKYICDARGRLMGAHILGSRAGDIIHEAQILKCLGIPFHKLASVIHIYPTFSDVIRQPAKLAYVDKLRNNPFLKLAGKLMRKKD